MPQAIVRPRSPARFSGSFLRVLSQKDGWLLFLAKDLNSHQKCLGTGVMRPIEPGLGRVPTSSRFRDKGHS